MKSAVAFGRCSLMPAGEEAENALRKMARKYYPNEDLIEKEMAESYKAVQMYEIEIEHISGKEVQEK